VSVRDRLRSAWRVLCALLRFGAYASAYLAAVFSFWAYETAIEAAGMAKAASGFADAALVQTESVKKKVDDIEDDVDHIRIFCK
jgi:hypothetical protein